MVVENAVVDPDPTKVGDTPGGEQVKEPVEPVKEDAKKPEVAEIEIEGGKKVSMEELKKGYMLQEDYTQKTQGVAALSKRLKTMTDFIDNPENKDKVTMIQAIAAGEEYIKKEQKKLPAKAEFEDEAVTEMRTELADAKKELTDLKKGVKSIQDNASEKDKTALEKDVVREQKEVKAKHPDLDDEDINIIFSMAMAEDGANLVDTADKYVKKLSAMKTKHIKAYLDAKDEDKGNFVETKGMAPGTPPKKLSLHDGSAKKAFASHLKELTKD